MRFPTPLLAIVSLLGTACGGGAGGAAAPQTPSASAVCLPVAPMQLLVLEHGSEWEPVASLAADGSFSLSVNKRDRAVLRLAADELRDAQGAPKMSCDASRVLHMNGSALTMQFDASDALVGSGNDRSRIFVSDTGDVVVDFGGAPRAAPWRIAGVSPGTRRTAELLVLSTLASADWGR